MSTSPVPRSLRGSAWCVGVWSGVGDRSIRWCVCVSVSWGFGGTQGNIQGWGGPLSQDFIQAQYKLQLQIVNATRAYGMINVRRLWFACV